MKYKIAFFAFSIIAFSFMISAEIDLKEANVMDVERIGDRFSVTLYHDDSGESGYANWWQIETLEGDRIVRRELLHSHGTQNFTRSDTVEIPDNTSKVVVRGHDQIHGYGGQTIIYNIETGEKRFVDQGSEPGNLSQTGLEEQDKSKNRSEKSNIQGHEHPHPHPHSDSGESTNTVEEILFTLIKLI